MLDLVAAQRRQQLARVVESSRDESISGPGIALRSATHWLSSRHVSQRDGKAWSERAIIATRVLRAGVLAARKSRNIVSARKRDHHRIMHSFGFVVADQRATQSVGVHPDDGICFGIEIGAAAEGDDRDRSL